MSKIDREPINNKNAATKKPARGSRKIYKAIVNTIKTMSFGIRWGVASTLETERMFSTKYTDAAKNMMAPTIIGKSSKDCKSS